MPGETSGITRQHKPVCLGGFPAGSEASNSALPVSTYTTGAVYSCLGVLNARLCAHPQYATVTHCLICDVYILVV